MTQLVLTDDEISVLLSTHKTVTNPRARWKQQSGSMQKNYKVKSTCGLHFVLYLRQNIRLEESFSCGLRYCHPEGKHKDVTLCRYNGNDHIHENPLEGKGKIYNQCHIHHATQRYMAAGRKAEHYAETTARYDDLQGAVLALCQDCHIDFPARTGPLSDVHNDMWGDDSKHDD